MTEAVAGSPDDLSSQAELFGHPVGLYVCFTTELWERFSFYGMKYLLLLYLTKYHLFTDGEMELKEQYERKIQYKENFLYADSEEECLIGIAIEKSMQSILN